MLALSWELPAGNLLILQVPHLGTKNPLQWCRLGSSSAEKFSGVLWTYGGQQPECEPAVCPGNKGQLRPGQHEQKYSQEIKGRGYSPFARHLFDHIWNTTSGFEPPWWRKMLTSVNKSSRDLWRCKTMKLMRCWRMTGKGCTPCPPAHLFSSCGLALLLGLDCTNVS